jgi:MFS transporter, DHA2 family, multidrug resistance protein
MSDAPERHVPLAASVSTSIGFSVMCVGMFVAILDVQVVATSLLTIQSALNIPPDQMRVRTVYLIAEVVALPLTGLLTRLLRMCWFSSRPFPSSRWLRWGAPPATISPS